MKQVFGILLLSVAFFCSANNSANSGANNADMQMITIEGKVIDFETKESLAGVTINISDYKAYTDLEGNFNIEVPSTYMADNEIKISYISYQETTISISTETLDVIEIKQIN
ncbi:MAG: carboxypeptidase-like regulatory domain-containing protein [Bacteroidota bacterium]